MNNTNTIQDEILDLQNKINELQKQLEKIQKKEKLKAKKNKIIIDNQETFLLKKFKRVSGYKKQNVLNELFLYCQDMVCKIANEYKDYGVDVKDLIAEGNIGLLTAFNYFNFNRTFGFKDYSSWLVRQYIIRGLCKKHLIKIPVEWTNILIKIDNINKIYYMKYGKYPNNDNIANELDITIKRLNDILSNSYNIISFDEIVKLGNENVRLVDIIIDEETPSPEAHLHHNETIRLINIELDKLRVLEKETIIMRYGLIDGCEMSLFEVSRHFNVTKERIRQIEAKALKKLRNPLRTDNLRHFIEDEGYGKGDTYYKLKV